MRQSQTYRRGQKGNATIDPNKYITYRMGVAARLHKREPALDSYDLWQLSAVPAFFLWILRRPIGFFKRRKLDRKMRKKLAKSNSNQSNHE